MGRAPFVQSETTGPGCSKQNFIKANTFIQECIIICHHNRFHSLSSGWLTLSSTDWDGKPFRTSATLYPTQHVPSQNPRSWDDIKTPNRRQQQLLYLPNNPCHKSRQTNDPSNFYLLYAIPLLPALAPTCPIRNIRQPAAPNLPFAYLSPSGSFPCGQECEGTRLTAQWKRFDGFYRGGQSETVGLDLQSWS